MLRYGATLTGWDRDVQLVSVPNVLGDSVQILLLGSNKVLSLAEVEVLSSRMELEADCAARTGCMGDHKLSWTSKNPANEAQSLS